MLCKYFGALSVASSVQVTLQLCVKMFYSIYEFTYMKTIEFHEKLEYVREEVDKHGNMVRRKEKTEAKNNLV